MRHAVMNYGIDFNLIEVYQWGHITPHSIFFLYEKTLKNRQDYGKLQYIDFNLIEV
jgi:hypothetical protein